MKKLLSTLVVFLLSVTFIYAVPAYPDLITVTQPDGTTISFYLRGDENFSFSMSEDGYLLTRNEKGIFEYADLTDGNIVSLGVKASNVNMRTVEEVNFLEKAVKVSSIQMQLTEVTNVRKQQKAERNVQRAIKYPTQGSPKSLVILVNFKDVKFIKETANIDFTNMLNQDGYSENKATSSAREYFRTSSFGQFDPNFIVVGPYDLPNEYSFYGANSANGAHDVHADSMIIHACRLADEAGLDFTEFDTDSNGYLDNVFVYYAGHNEAEGASSETVWPHRGGVYSKDKFDGIKVNVYACTSELRGQKGTEQCGIGTFVHEFGHVLELPDLYVTDYSHSEPTLGRWDVMDRGPYNNEGRTPPTYSAYERFFLGWLKPEPLDSIGLHKLEPLITSNKAYIFSRTKHNLDGYSPDPTEFFMLENRQKIGIDSLGVPGEDLLITHINYNKSLWMTGWNNPNKDPDDMCVEIECASGNTNDAKRNTYPGFDNIFEFEFKFKDRTLWENPLQGIQKKGNDIFFVYGEDENTPNVSYLNSLPDFYSYANQRQAKDLKVSVNNIEGEVKFVFEYPGYFLLAQRLEDGTITTPESELIVNIPSKEEHMLDIIVYFNPRNRVSNDDFWATRIFALSDNFIASLPIQGKSRRSLEINVPIALDPTSVTENSFVANWSYDEKATGYYLSVYSKEDTPSEEIEEFDDFADGNNPKGWFYNFLSKSGLYKGSAPWSLEFTSVNDTLWTKNYIMPVSSFDFWVRSNKEARGNILVDGFIDSTWINVLTQPFNAETINQIMTADVAEECSKFRIYVDFETEGGSLFFDDFKVKFDYSLNYIIQDEEIYQEEGLDNKRVIRDCDLKQKIYYRVRATDKQLSDEEGKFENLSDYSNEICVGQEDDTKKTTRETLNISFANGSFVVNLKELKSGYKIYIYTADGRLVKEIEPSSKNVVLPRLDSNMYIVKYSQTGKITRNDAMGKIFY